jgi:hypothetical protein
MLWTPVYQKSFQKEKPSLPSKFFPPKFPFPKYKRKFWREKIYFAKKRGSFKNRLISNADQPTFFNDFK